MERELPRKLQPVRKGNHGNKRPKKKRRIGKRKRGGKGPEACAGWYFGRKNKWGIFGLALDAQRSNNNKRKKIVKEKASKHFHQSKMEDQGGIPGQKVNFKKEEGRGNERG